MSSRAVAAISPAASIKRALPHAPGALLQRKCACGGSAGQESECEECKKKKLQRHAAGTGPGIAPPVVHEVLNSSGQPLDSATRSFFEPRFGYDFSKVRVHTDRRAHESARAVSALAYTVGDHLVFGPGQFAPSTSSGQRLLAHELTHVIQQTQGRSASIQRKLEVGAVNDSLEQEAERYAEQITTQTVAGTGAPPPPPSNGSGSRLQRAPADTGDVAASPTTVPPTTGLIVEDDATAVGPGQMRKSEFLDGLRASVCATADSVLLAIGRTAQGCPFIERWIARLRTRTGGHIERAIRKYAPESASASTARDYYAAVGNRVREGVSRWASTGEISGVPPELMSEMAGGGVLGAIGGALSSIAGAIGSVASGIGGLFTKAKDGGAREGNPAAIQAQLTGGAPLESGVRARMETAFGHGFSHVRVHSDARAAQLSSSLNARAFTIGTDVAFGAGEYKPGTLIGDALIAHELAHVMQQSYSASSAAPITKGAAEYNTLEEDADMSAVGAMLSLWSGTKATLKALGRSAGPRLRSGLRLQRCASDKPAVQAVKPEMTNIKWGPNSNCAGVEGKIGAALGQALASVRAGLGALASPKNVADPLMKNFKISPDDSRVERIRQVLQGAIESMEATAQNKSTTASLGTTPTLICVPCDSDVYGGTTYGCGTSQPVPLIIQLCVKNGQLASSNPTRTMIHEFIHASCGRTQAVVSSPSYITQGTGVSIAGGTGEIAYQKPQADIAKNLQSAYSYAQFVMDVTGQ
jgi:uncharacterized protein DUF4157